MKLIWVDKDKCLGCKTCELGCAVERGSVSRTLAGAMKEDVRPAARVGVFGVTGASFPLQCRHCQEAVCIKACPSGAMQRESAVGVVAVDAAKCRGCWMCVMSCPFGAVAPASTGKAAVKCDACKDMDAPACVSCCPTGALLYHDTADQQPSRKVKGRQVAIAVHQAAAVMGAGLISLNQVREERGS